MNSYADMLVAADFALDLGLDGLALALQGKARAQPHDPCISSNNSHTRPKTGIDSRSRTSATTFWRWSLTRCGSAGDRWSLSRTGHGEHYDSRAGGRISLSRTATR